MTKARDIANIIGSSNTTIIGPEAGVDSTGAAAVALGEKTLKSAGAGENNIAIGKKSFDGSSASNFGGSNNNISLGTSAGESFSRPNNPSGDTTPASSKNVMMGHKVGAESRMNGTHFQYYSGYGNQAADVAEKNVFIGNYAGYKQNFHGVGLTSDPSTGNPHVGYDYTSAYMRAQTPVENVWIGYGAGRYSTGLSGSVLLGVDSGAGMVGHADPYDSSQTYAAKQGNIIAIGNRSAFVVPTYSNQTPTHSVAINRSCYGSAMQDVICIGEYSGTTTSIPSTNYLKYTVDKKTMIAIGKFAGGIRYSSRTIENGYVGGAMGYGLFIGYAAGSSRKFANPNPDSNGMSDNNKANEICIGRNAGAYTGFSSYDISNMPSAKTSYGGVYYSYTGGVSAMDENISIGRGAGSQTKAAAGNINLGGAAGGYNDASKYNINLGGGAGSQIKVSGYGALNGTGSDMVSKSNIFIGDRAGWRSHHTKSNIAIGNYTHHKGMAGENSIFIGQRVGNQSHQHRHRIIEIGGQGHTSSSGYGANTYMHPVVNNAIVLGFSNFSTATSSGSSDQSSLFPGSGSESEAKPVQFPVIVGHKNEGMATKAVAVGSNNYIRTPLNGGSSADNSRLKQIIIGNDNEITATYNESVASHSNTNILIGDLNSIANTSYNTSGGQISLGNRTRNVGKDSVAIGHDADGGGVDKAITLGASTLASLRSNQTSISSLSDLRDKSNIEELTLGLEFINSVRPVKFTWDRRTPDDYNGKVAAGFIAQEVLEAQTDADAAYMDLVDESNPEQLHVKAGNILPALVKAIQELTDRVEALEAKLSE